MENKWDRILDGEITPSDINNIQTALDNGQLFTIEPAPLQSLYLALSYFDDFNIVLPLMQLIAKNEQARKAIDNEQNSFIDLLLISTKETPEGTIQILNLLNWPLTEKDNNGQGILHSIVKFNVSPLLIDHCVQQAPSIINMTNNIGDSPLLLALHLNNIQLADRLYQLNAKLPDLDEDNRLSGIATGWLRRAFLTQRAHSQLNQDAPAIITTGKKRL